jgi:hypothetical protein
MQPHRGGGVSVAAVCQSTPTRFNHYEIVPIVSRCTELYRLAKCSVLS